MKLKVVLHYIIEDEDITEDTLRHLSGDDLGARIAQENMNEFLDSLDEKESKATVQLVDDEDNVVKEKNLMLEF